MSKSNIGKDAVKELIRLIMGHMVEINADEVKNLWDNMATGSGSVVSVTIEELISKVGESLNMSFDEDTKIITLKMNDNVIGTVDLSMLKTDNGDSPFTYDDMAEAIQRIIDENPDRFKGEDAVIDANFMSEGGFGNLRYYNGHFQYFNTETGEWVDTTVTPDNVYIINMIPQSLTKIIGVYDHEIGHYKLKWEEPDDTIINGQVASVVEKVVIRRKLNEVPVDENDGEFVTEIKRPKFGQHVNDWFVDETLTPNMGDVYYYKAFPLSTLGFTNYSASNETRGILAKDYILYGISIDTNESNPDSMISYIEDNEGFEPARMDYNLDKFNYGDWKDAWFIRDLRPVMLNYDGSVAYALNKNDQTLKLDGTASDVSNADFEGNAMIEFPRVYWKIDSDENGDNAKIYISDKKVDDTFNSFSHMDSNGNEIDYCYLPAYDGSLVGNRLRSLSGRAPLNYTTREQEIAYAIANNVGDDKSWYTGVMCDWIMINLLSLLIAKTPDSKKAFGTGNNNSYVNTSNTGIKNSGTLDKKGLFHGYQDNVSCVKIFGIENFYGNIWKAIAGWIMDKGVQKLKLTYSKKDGSDVEGYNLDGEGYVVIPDSTPSGTNGGFLNKAKFVPLGIIPVTANGSATTYYTVGFWFNNGIVAYALVGGHAAATLRVGALYSHLDNAVSVAYWGVGASLSCKPTKRSA